MRSQRVIALRWALLSRSNYRASILLGLVSLMLGCAADEVKFKEEPSASPNLSSSPALPGKAAPAPTPVDRKAIEEFHADLRRSVKEVQAKAPEAVRKKIFREAEKAGEQASKDAENNYSLDLPGHTMQKRGEYAAKLDASYKTDLGKKYGLTLRNIEGIVFEGRSKEWPDGLPDGSEGEP